MIIRKTCGEGQNNIIVSDYFKTDKVVVKNKLEDKSNPETFYAYNVVSGNGKLLCGVHEYTLSLGESFIIPANLGNYVIEGDIELLKSYL